MVKKYLRKVTLTATEISEIHHVLSTYLQDYKDNEIQMVVVSKEDLCCEADREIFVRQKKMAFKQTVKRLKKLERKFHTLSIDLEDEVLQDIKTIRTV